MIIIVMIVTQKKKLKTKKKTEKQTPFVWQKTKNNRIKNTSKHNRVDNSRVA